MRRGSWTLLLALAALLANTPALAADLTVFAAASLTDAFTELGKAFDARTGNRTTFQFAGSQVLRTQLENGARADVFASADTVQYDSLVASGLMAPGSVFARNRLVVIATKRGRGNVKTLADLARPGVKLVLAGPTVPVGRYTRTSLEALTRSGRYGADYGRRVLANVVSEETNVRQVALKVSLGEADAGVVYVSDVTPTLRPSVLEIAIPASFNQTAAYPVGVARNAAQPEAARAFLAYLLSNEGQAVLKKWGLLGAGPD